MRYDWTDDKIEALSRMWLKEGLSASQIGAKLGTSRNSVVGKIHRLGLGLRPAHVRQRKTEALFGSYITIKPPRHFPEVYAPNGSRCAIEDLEAFDRKCRYPHGAAAPYTFCGGTAVPGSSYCLAHLQACYTQPPKAAAAFVEQQAGEVFTGINKNPAEARA